VTGASDTFEQCSAAVLAAIRAGASIDDAARHAGCSGRTVKRWLAQGRAAPALAPYGRFAASVDAARAEQGLPEEEVMDLDELKVTATRAARKGSVPAMRLIANLIGAGPDPNRPDVLDALRARRRERVMANGGSDPYPDGAPPGGWEGLA
jgi:transposase-like protein